MNNIKFTKRPIPVIPEHRPLYKMAQILIMLAGSRGGKSSILRLHLLNWSVKTSDRAQVLRSAASQGGLKLATWGFDPALVSALNYASAEGLIKNTSTGYQIEEKGKKFLELILKDENSFNFEIDLMTIVGKKITESMVDAVAKDWG